MAARERASGTETRAKILQFATRRFADRGFAETRLEDIASDVGFRRAALFYYFRDKAELYDEVLSDLWTDLFARIQAAHDSGSTIAERMERGAMAMIDAMAERPFLARIILRESSSSSGEEHTSALEDAPLVEQLKLDLAEGIRNGELNPQTEDPYQVVAIMSGMTLFWVAAMVPLHSEMTYDPLSPDAVAEHKRLALTVLRTVLGTE